MHEYKPKSKMQHAECTICNLKTHVEHNEYAWFQSLDRPSGGMGFLSAEEAFADAKQELGPMDGEGGGYLRIDRVVRPDPIEWFQRACSSDTILESMHDFARDNGGGEFAEDFMREIPEDQALKLDEAMTSAFTLWFKNLPPTVRIGDDWYEEAQTVLEARRKSNEDWTVVAALDENGALRTVNPEISK